MTATSARPSPAPRPGRHHHEHLGDDAVSVDRLVGDRPALPNGLHRTGYLAIIHRAKTPRSAR